jgi:NADH:ubiquinone oxidoreductase subunit 3 (subunit A)
MRIVLITLVIILAMPVIGAYIGIAVGNWIKNSREKEERMKRYEANH